MRRQDGSCVATNTKECCSSKVHNSNIAKLNIYSGEGNTGALLSTQYVKINQPTTGFVTQDFILNSPVALIQNAVYTAELVAVSTQDKISFFNFTYRVFPLYYDKNL